jgi:hypothetical protein
MLARAAAVVTAAFIMLLWHARHCTDIVGSISALCLWGNRGIALVKVFAKIKTPVSADRA